MSQQRDREELLSMLHRRTDQNLQMPQIPPSNSLMVEPLPAARQSAEPIDTEMRYESEEPASASELFSSTAAKKEGSPPHRRSPLQQKETLLQQKPLHLERRIPLRQKEKNHSLKKSPLGMGSIRVKRVKSRLQTVRFGSRRASDLTAKGTKDVEEGSQSTEKEEPNLRAVTKSLPKRDKKGSTTKTSITKTAKELVAKTNKKEVHQKLRQKMMKPMFTRRRPILS
ncbi:hypothetical protein QTG54_005000 [Skeletonema marinoi]|uniref:Uncharacterized protein n=1 Tax=Skeletonema marinoi TaxID=267567 RepID=A0AAD8YE15_9STRA|nr:hypothetical protein QTG54_005000 [Skeletonema marinoi]